ncbi:MAG: hypothetical protein J6Y89_05360, partial [Lachnospiraceae bacterium]|nr:hypothetical protein [Lachnospiraceae bacterium]
IIQKNKAVRTERLSSGYRINRAADDAAGLSISEKMRGQIRGLNRAAQNVQDGISFVQTGEGALNEVHSMLQRIRELCVQAANDTYTKEDRSCINDEVQQLKEEIQRIFDETQFNTIYIFRAPYTPTVMGDPNDYKFFNVGTSSPPKTGGIMINNYRYTYDELGVPQHTSADWSKTFTDPTGELISLFLPADNDCDKMRRVYHMSANEDGILINNKLAATWGGTITQNGDTYSFSYHGMDISFTSQSGASLEDVISHLQPDGLTGITWQAIPDVFDENYAVSSSGSSMTLQATNTNKHDIQDYEFRLVADATGIHIEQTTSTAHNAVTGSVTETPWADFSDVSTGEYPIADWGMPGEDHDPVTLDDSAVYHYRDKNEYDGGTASKIDFMFNFLYDEVGKEVTMGALSTPLASSLIDAPVSVRVTSANSSNITLQSYADDYDFQVDQLLRDFGADGNSLNPMDITITRTKVVDDPDYVVYENRRNLVEAYVKKNTVTNVNKNTSWNKTYTLEDGTTRTDLEGITGVSGLPLGNFNGGSLPTSTTTESTYELNIGQRQRLYPPGTTDTSDEEGAVREGSFTYIDGEGIERTGSYRYVENIHTVTTINYLYNDENNYYKDGNTYRNSSSALYIYGGDDSTGQRDVNGDFNYRATNSDWQSTDQRYLHQGDELKPNLVYELCHYEYTVTNSAGDPIMTGRSGSFINTSSNVRDSAEDIAKGPTTSTFGAIYRLPESIEGFRTASGQQLKDAGISTDLSNKDIELATDSGDKKIKLRYDDRSDIDGTQNSSVNIRYTPTKQATRTFSKRAYTAGNSTQTHYSMYQPDEPMKELNIQAGPNTAQAIKLKWNALTNSVIGISGINTLTRDKADACISDSDVGIAFISKIRSYFGAMQNRMEFAKSIDLNTSENTQAAESLIRDANMADEILAFSLNDILAQAAQAMLAHAKIQGQGILALLG